MRATMAPDSIIQRVGGPHPKYSRNHISFLFALGLFYVFLPFFIQNAVQLTCNGPAIFFQSGTVSTCTHRRGELENFDHVDRSSLRTRLAITQRR
jgi:hypothetical protein